MKVINTVCFGQLWAADGVEISYSLETGLLLPGHVQGHRGYTLVVCNMPDQVAKIYLKRMSRF